VIELQAARTEAERAKAEAESILERTTFELAAAKAQVMAAEEDVAATMAELGESDARHAAIADQLARLNAMVKAARDTAGEAGGRLAKAEAALAQESQELAQLAERLDQARSGESQVSEPDGAERDRLAATRTQAMGAKTEALLVVRAAEERLQALTERVAATRRAAEAERQAEAKARAKAEVRRAQAVVAAAVERAASALEVEASRATAAARDRRDQVEGARAAREAELAQVRAEIEAQRTVLAELTDVAHRDELAKASQQMRLDALQAKALEELGLEPEVRVDEFGPDREVPSTDPEGAPSPYVREDQEKRLRRATRELSALGRVNPLALEEYAALEERHRFLSEQLTDLKKSRADLMEVIREIDGRVEQVFAEAYQDTEVAFAKVFSRLFPGGEGKLIATEPGQWLTTGIDIEARPAGKSVRRLSLLSGGERSLVAVGFTLAIFMARPSPFYVMDEVEAALDETNLGRLLDIVAELRARSQILMVTHQKRTMEIADALYGVTMRDDGVTTVISQRLREDT
jgi:chromosome segregation protein